MKTGIRMGSSSVWSMVLLATCLFLAPGTGAAAVDCAAVAGDPALAALDTDDDGFNDGLECSSITLWDNSTYSGLDPDLVDIFLISEVDGTSLLTTLIEEIYYQTLPTDPITNAGLGFRFHPITLAQTNGRIVCQEATQRAMYFIEDTIKDLYELGFKQPLGTTESQGTPESVDWGKVYTKRIMQLIEGECGAGFTGGPGDANVCSDLDGNTGYGLLHNWALKVYGHEGGHYVDLANVTAREVDRNGGYHTKTGDGTIMDQATDYKYSKKDGKTIFYIYYGYRPLDQASAQVSP